MSNTQLPDGATKDYCNEQVLKFLEDNAIINLDDVRDNMREQERQRLLSKHEYKISSGSDGRWKTTLPDPTKKDKRRLIAKRNLKDLEDEVIEFYRIEEKKYIRQSKELLTLEDIYPLWLQSRKLEVQSINTVKKNDQDWKRYYINDPIIKVPLMDMTVQMLKDWAHKKIDENKFNKRDYYNMAIIIKQCFQYAKDSEFIDDDIWEKVKINTKKLRKCEKKSNEKEIFFVEEQKQLIEYCFYMFQKNPRNITALIIPLIFVTGLRAGEVVSLKYEDIDDKANKIMVRNSETVLYKLDEDGIFTYLGKEVVDHAKTDAGEREVPCTSYAKKIIQMVKESSEEFGYYDGGYIFCPYSKRVSANSIDKKLYNYCNAIGIDKKSAHKIRKTFISKLIHSKQIDIDTVCRIAGHDDMKTTFMSYCFSLDHGNEIQNKLEDVLSIGIS